MVAWPGKSRLSNVAVELETVGSVLDKLLQSSLETIYATQIKSKLDPCLFQVIRELTDPSTTDTAALLKIIPLLDKSILPQLQALSEDNLMQLILMVSRAIASQLESVLATSQSWPQERLEGFETDLRRLTSFLASLTELQAKEAFVHIAKALADMQEGIFPHKPPTSLSDAQIESILQSRDAV